MNKNVVVGIDVSKNFSEMCILATDNEIIAQMKIYHNVSDFTKVITQLHNIEKEYNVPVVVVMESTSHYHLIPYQFFQKAGFEVIVVNPVQSGALRNLNIRKVKNDKVDAHKIALLYRLKILRPAQIPQGNLRCMRMLCRQRSELLVDAARYKNRLRVYLEQVFPGYDTVFCDIGGVSSRAVLRECPTPELVLLKGMENVDAIINAAAPNRGFSFSHKKAEQLICAAQAAKGSSFETPGSDLMIKANLTVLESLLDSVRQIESKLEELSLQEEYIRNNLLLLRTIPGIGIHSSLVILSEIGDFALFKKPKELVAYFGLDPGERQSGTFRGTKNKMSKRGSGQARAALHMAAVNAISLQTRRTVGNPVLAEYYRNKCKTKPPKVAMCAVMRKLVNIIFAVLRDRKPFELRTAKEHAIRLGMAAAA